MHFIGYNILSIFYAARMKQAKQAGHEPEKAKGSIVFRFLLEKILLHSQKVVITLYMLACVGLFAAQASVCFKKFLSQPIGTR